MLTGLRNTFVDQYQLKKDWLCQNINILNSQPLFVQSKQ